MTDARPLTITYIGGPTALIDWGGLRLLTDPGFDPPGEYKTGPVVLRKTAGPALPPESLGRVDIALLSHDHHADNLDHSGRAFLTQVGSVFTTPAGAERLGGHTTGLANWQSSDIVRTAVLFMGAARVPAVGTTDALTMTAADGIEAARAFSHATIVPLHFEGWEHFSESREVIARAFDAAGIGRRVRWMAPGDTITVTSTAP